MIGYEPYKQWLCYRALWYPMGSSWSGDMITRGVLILLIFPHFLPECVKTGSLGTTENEVWIDNFKVKARKTTKYKLHKIWWSLKFCKILGKRTHPCKQYNQVSHFQDMVFALLSNLFHFLSSSTSCSSFIKISCLKLNYSTFWSCLTLKEYVSFHRFFL